MLHLVPLQVNVDTSKRIQGLGVDDQTIRPMVFLSHFGTIVTVRILVYRSANQLTMFSKSFPKHITLNI